MIQPHVLYQVIRIINLRELFVVFPPTNIAGIFTIFEERECLDVFVSLVLYSIRVGVVNRTFKTLGRMSNALPLSVLVCTICKILVKY